MTLSCLPVKICQIPIFHAILSMLRPSVGQDSVTSQASVEPVVSLFGHSRVGGTACSITTMRSS